MMRNALVEQGGTPTDQVDALDGDGVNPECLVAAAKVRVLRHQLQHKLLTVAAPDAYRGGPVASHAELAWVHDQVMSRPYVAQVVTHWFRSTRRISREQVRALQHVVDLAAAIEELAPEHSLGDPRLLAALAALTIRQSD